MSDEYSRITADLRRYYEAGAAEREQDQHYPAWEAQEREQPDEHTI